jgi:hypothetical protein
MTKIRSLVVVPLALWIVSGCTSDPSAKTKGANQEQTSSSGAIADELSTPASEKTKAATGVERWGTTVEIQKGQKIAIIRGYGADEKSRAEFRISGSVIGGDKVFGEVASVKPDPAILRFRVTRGKQDAKVVETDLTDHPEAVRMFGFVKDDFERRSTSLGGTQAPSLSTSTSAKSFGVHILETPLLCDDNGDGCTLSAAGMMLTCAGAVPVCIVAGVFTLGAACAAALAGCGITYADLATENCGPCDGTEGTQAQCESKCTPLLSKTCNYVGDDGVPGTKDDAPSCDSIQREYADCENRCEALKD